MWQGQWPHEHQGLCWWRGLRWSRGPWRGDWQLYGYHLGELAWSHLQPWGPGWSRDIPSGHHWLGWVQHLFPSHKLWGSPLQCWLRHAVCLRKSVAPGVCGLSSSFFLRESHPQKTSLLVKERYHFTSSLSSKTLLTNKCGSPLAGRLFHSAQCWRALAYTTTFSPGISWMSLHTKDWVGWGHKPLSVEAWQCRGSLESGFPWIQFPQLPWKSEGCPHLPG